MFVMEHSKTDTWNINEWVVLSELLREAIEKLIRNDNEIKLNFISYVKNTVSDILNE